jgi:O-antigen/teichoic acid export membrane protein
MNRQVPVEISGNRGTILISAGTLIGQASLMVSMPIISRIWSPQEIGYFVVFTSVVSLFSTTASLHYELSIPLPNNGKHASLLMQLSLIIVFFCSCLFLCGIALGNLEQILTGINEIEPVKFWLPLSFLLNGVCAVWSIRSIRHQKYVNNAASKGIQGIVQSIVQLVAGAVGYNWKGLVLGQIAGQLAGILPFLDNLALGPRFTRKVPLRYYVLLRRYRNFAIAATPSSLINAFSNNIPPLFLSALFSPDSAGLYGVGARVLQIPMRFIGQALGQVFLGQAAIARRNGHLPSVANSIYHTLFVFSVNTFIPIAIISPSLFAFVFGENWANAGDYARWLAPWLLTSFIANPLSMLVTVLEKQRQELCFQIVYLVLISGALVAGKVLNNSNLAIFFLGLVGATFNCFKIFWLLNLSGCRKNSVLKVTVSELLIAIGSSSVLIACVMGGISDKWLSIVGVSWIVILHIFSYSGRKVYSF